jgi:hypothetical protein
MFKWTVGVRRENRNILTYEWNEYLHKSYRGAAARSAERGEAGQDPMPAARPVAEDVLGEN